MGVEITAGCAGSGRGFVDHLDLESSSWLGIWEPISLGGLLP